jgi:hypothetical protein
MGKYNIEQLKLDLGCSVRSFCLWLFPNGKYENREYCVGSLAGEPGDSLKICMIGKKTGVWKDFASGEGGDNLLDLLYRVRGVKFSEACREAAEWLGNPERYGININSFLRMQESEKYRIERKELEVCRCGDLRSGNKEERAALSALLGVNIHGILQAELDGVLKFSDHALNGRCWVVVDRGAHVRQDRRLDGRQFLLKNNTSVKARTIGSPKWPVGTPTDRQILTIVEGSSDFLAAYSLICDESLEEYVAPVTILGAANVICEEALKFFRGKYILAFPDYDRAGVNGMARWERQLKSVAAVFEVFDYAGVLRDDSRPVKDLRDFLRIDTDQCDNSPDVRSPLSNFVSKLLKEGKIHVANSTNNE